jgi:hypothetical protein
VGLEIPPAQPAHFGEAFELTPGNVASERLAVARKAANSCLRDSRGSGALIGLSVKLAAAGVPSERRAASPKGALRARLVNCRPGVGIAMLQQGTPVADLLADYREPMVFRNGSPALSRARVVCFCQPMAVIISSSAEGQQRRHR